MVDGNRMNKDRMTCFLILTGFSASMSIPLVLWGFRKPEYLLNRIGFNESALSLHAAWALSLLIAIAYILYTFKAVPFVWESWSEFSVLKIIGIWAALASGIIEEIFFREMVMDWLLSTGLGNVLQVVVSALLFGLAHTLWFLFRRDAKIIVPVVVSTTALGILLGLLFLVSHRILLPCIVSHILINLVIEPWLILSAVSGTMGNPTRRKHGIMRQKT
jgi:hypothetical protein